MIVMRTIGQFPLTLRRQKQSVLVKQHVQLINYSFIIHRDIAAANIVGAQRFIDVGESVS